MAESMVIERMYRLCKEVVAVFEQKYLTTPNEEDTAQIPRTLGSIDLLLFSNEYICNHAKYDY
jgi:hypothetical protein